MALGYEWSQMMRSGDPLPHLELVWVQMDQIAAAVEVLRNRG